jgi:diguanylate cyclase (GGDEF)-like protein
MTTQKSLSSRLLGLTILIVLTMSAVMMLVISQIYQVRIHQEFENRGQAAARMVTCLLNGEAVDRYLDSLEKDESYRLMLHHLRTLQRENGFKYVYVLRPVEGGSLYVFDTDEVEGLDLGEFFSWLDDWGEGFDDYYMALRRGERVEPVITKSEKWGTLLSIYEPIARADGSVAAYAGVDIAMEKIFQERLYTLSALGLAIPFLIIVFSALHHVAINRLIISPVNSMAEEVSAMEKSILRLETEADKAYYDALTGLHNRRFFDLRLKQTMKVLSRSESPLSLMMIDIDHFKEYNDTYGHTQGDNCLKTVAAVLKGGVTRDGDFVARYGGDEFVVVLPNTDEQGARLLAGNLLENMCNRKIPHEKSAVAAWVTISIGVATGRVKHAHDPDDYAKRADEMLYKSKQGGRNRYNFINL